MLSLHNSTPLNVVLYLYIFLNILFVLKYFNMDLMRIFQQHVPEPPIKEKDVNPEIVSLTGTMEKETMTDETKDKTKELESKVTELTEQNKDLHVQLQAKDQRRDEMNRVVISYEAMLDKLVTDNRVVTQEREMAKTHLANLELAFHDLIEKYERAKTIITGYETNEATFKEHLTQFECTVELIETKYTDFKSYAIDKLNEANRQLKKNEKEYMQEVSKLKAKIIQSQSRINDMERQISRLSLKIGNGDSARTEGSIFEPLVNNIT